jgi:putative mRNA 3-end processing factor
VERAVVTHGHSDHARPGHRHVLATAANLAIMRLRLGNAAGASHQALEYGETLELGGGGGGDGVRLRLVPAGHVLGSAQVVLEHGGARVVVSGDYKRAADRTCAPFEPVPCDLFITEATFGLPVYRHPPDGAEIARLNESLRLFPERTHVIGAYGLGKCQRVISLLRGAGWDGPVYLHPSLLAMCELYGRFGVGLGDLRPVVGATSGDLRGALVLAPPGGVGEAWGGRLTDPVVAVASGWMRVRRWARQRGAELPLVISDHADWDELIRTVDDVQAPQLRVTHGWAEPLVHHARQRGIDAAALDHTPPRDGEDG